MAACLDTKTAEESDVMLMFSLHISMKLKLMVTFWLSLESPRPTPRMHCPAGWRTRQQESASFSLYRK